VTSDDSVRRLLTFCARPRMPAALQSELFDRIGRVNAWDEVLQVAECHGLGPLLYWHLRTAGHVPADVKLQLRGVYLRNQFANGVRLRALGAVLDALGAQGIDARVLKGPALFRLVYGDPALRPISDLDILVLSRDALRAQDALEALGYEAATKASGASLTHHHHLPMLTQWVEGVRLQVEIHHDALSRDYRASMRLGGDREPATVVEVEGRPALALGLHDMLWHLCQHLVGPLPRPLRLIWIADIAGLAEVFTDRIDWEREIRRHRVVANVLGLIHGLAPLPAEVARHIPPQAIEHLRDVASDRRVWAWVPGGRMPDETRLQQLSRVLRPPAWWVALRYGRAGGRLDAGVRRLRHLAASGRAIRRRAWPTAR
jgi:hypothetical protein